MLVYWFFFSKFVWTGSSSDKRKYLPAAASQRLRTTALYLSQINAKSLLSSINQHQVNIIFHRLFFSISAIYFSLATFLVNLFLTACKLKVNVPTKMFAETHGHSFISPILAVPISTTTTAPLFMLILWIPC